MSMPSTRWRAADPPAARRTNWFAGPRLLREQARLQSADGRTKQPAGLGLWSYWRVLAFMAISLLDFFVFVRALLVMGIVRVLGIWEFRGAVQVTAAN